MPKAKKVVSKAVLCDEKQVVEKVATLKVPNVVESLAKLKLQVQNQVDSITNDITGRLGELEAVNTAIELQNRRLAELYELEAGAVSLEDVKLDREHIEEENARLKSELLIERNREQDDFNYKLVKSRRAEQDSHDKMISEKTALLNKRENDLKLSENELNELRKQVAGFDVEVKKAVDKELAILKNVLTKDFSQEKALLLKDHDSFKQLSGAKEAALNLQVASLQDSLNNLTLELDKQRAHVREITGNKSELDATRNSLETLRKTLENQNASINRK